MGATLLILARDQDPPGTRTKGEVVVVRPDTHVWGSKEGPPDFIRLTVSDATVEQVETFLDGWPIKYTFSIVNQNAAGWRFLVEVDPQFISASGVGRDQMKTEMQAWVTAPYPDEGAGGTVVSFTTSSMTCDVPKTGLGQAADDAKRAQLKLMFLDRFEFLFRKARFYFASADVDAALAAGGAVTRTRAQVLSIIQDRWTE